jgi:hypothetical protein
MVSFARIIAVQHCNISQFQDRDEATKNIAKCRVRAFHGEPAKRQVRIHIRVLGRNHVSTKCSLQFVIVN